MKVNIRNRDNLQNKIEISKIRDVIKELIKCEGKKLGEIEVILLRDEELLEINKNFLRHDYFTDVITFDYNGKDKINGDIFISTDRIKMNAIHYGEGFIDELFRVIIHGTLHLIGYKDQSLVERKLMKTKENMYLIKLGKLIHEYKI